MKNQVLLLCSMSISFGLRAEEISYPTSVHCPKSKEVIDLVKKIGPKVYAEIGISSGETAQAVSRVLPINGEIYLFDFNDKVSAVAKKLRANGFTHVHAYGNTYKYRDSYTWSLMKVLEKYSGPIFDFVFLDGSHMWDTDALAFFLIDRLLKPGGYIVFDDYNWTMAKSPTCRPDRFPLHDKMWTREQMRTPCVKKIVDLLVVTDDRYQKVSSTLRWIFKKIA